VPGNDTEVDPHPSADAVRGRSQSDAPELFAQPENLRANWRASLERARIAPSQNIVAAVGAVSLVVSVILWGTMASANMEGKYVDSEDYTGKITERSPTIAHWLSASLLLATACVLGVVWYARRESARLAVRERLDAGRRRQLRDVQDRTARSTEGGIIDLVDANRALLDAYQIPVRRQARTSYTYSQVAIGAGFSSLIIGVIVTASVDELAARIAIAALTAIGSTLAGYIAKTYLRVYEKAQDQLNFYFREPLVTSYLLTAERLAEKLDGERRQDAYADMISHIARAAGTDIAPTANAD
jgi:hypothetical protein